MNKITWRVSAASAPAAVRPCGKCGADATFLSTGLFRVNAQKKRLDVWLVYRCSLCGGVWNSAVISRKNSKNIDAVELERYCSNDARLALRCALDTDLLKHNGAKRGKVDFVVEGDLPAIGENCCVSITCTQHLGIKLAEVLRAKMGFSRAVLIDLVGQGQIVLVDDAEVLSARLQTQQTVILKAPQAFSNEVLQ